ncbi:hypothetical protein OH77DRAFT_856488 [Trametes cingulata]|nr:hypothetical protein OH77DRAFT_856488 [Trametes cingulata]
MITLPNPRPSGGGRSRGVMREPAQLRRGRSAQRRRSRSPSRIQKHPYIWDPSCEQGRAAQHANDRTGTTLRGTRRQRLSYLLSRRRPDESSSVRSSGTACCRRKPRVLLWDSAGSRRGRTPMTKGALWSHRAPEA